MPCSSVNDDDAAAAELLGSLVSSATTGAFCQSTSPSWSCDDGGVLGRPALLTESACDELEELESELEPVSESVSKV